MVQTRNRSRDRWSRARVHGESYSNCKILSTHLQARRLIAAGLFLFQNPVFVQGK